jgi:hypothetical protein
MAKQFITQPNRVVSLDVIHEAGKNRLVVEVESGEPFTEEEVRQVVEAVRATGVKVEGWSVPENGA